MKGGERAGEKVGEKERRRNKGEEAKRKRRRGSHSLNLDQMARGELTRGV